MQRREFVKTTGLFALGSALALGLSVGSKRATASTDGNLARISNKLQYDIDELFVWLHATGWSAYLRDTLGVNLELQGAQLSQELVRDLDEQKLHELQKLTPSGYDDFAGHRLVEPGFPGYSLLYHTLASPRVRPSGVQYPTLTQIDLLENYIYALRPWEQLRSDYTIDAKEPLYFAVFAYEYRPAFKTPHHECADLVFSRTGIARIGERPLHYDPLNRCHTNLPATAGDEARIAVVPARYGLFIARQVHAGDVAMITEDKPVGSGEQATTGEDPVLLQPIRKIFGNDLLIDEAPLVFKEVHQSEKLKKFAQINAILVSDKTNPGERDRIIPSTRTSAQLIGQDERIRNVGSSFLVVSRPQPLIRLARENGRALFFKVPSHKLHPFDTRNFSALCTQYLEDVDVLNGSNPVTRDYHKFPPLLDQSLFVNITNERAADTFHFLEKRLDMGFEKKVNKGGYYAPLFEDSICDGRVEVATDVFPASAIGSIATGCVPAFSVVAAPDFFPQVDPPDFAAFDVAPGSDTGTNFFAGGVASLACAQIPPNPRAIHPKSAPSPGTYLAVLSGSVRQHAGISRERLRAFKDPASDRGYDISGYLPDVASSIFAPGWDMTYSNFNGTSDIFLGTDGIGLPFVEDMKFCSALNGMWPATSPDGARTYQGSNERDYRSPTAVPLLDAELGICADGPAGAEHQCLGWDGEQGPYLQPHLGGWAVNFTDLGRADAVTNALTGKIDMSKLRKLKSAELIDRMACLRECIDALPRKNFNPAKDAGKVVGYTYLWLVSAEAADWGSADVEALGIPATLVGTNKNWVSRKENARVKGKGCLYLFADSEPDSEGNENKNWVTGKRRLLACHKIYICQVTTNAASPYKVAWADVTEGVVNWQLVK